MDLRAARDRLADQHPAGIAGHARPPGNVPTFPAYIVQDPSQIDYRPTMGDRQAATFAIRVIVARTDELATAALDDLVSELPALLEAITPDGKWRQLAITEATGGYAEFPQGGRVVGLSADLTARITF